MQVLNGTKRQITIMEWEELLEKYMKRINDGMECFRRYHDTNSLTNMKEDAQKIIEYCNHTADVIDFMDAHGIK